MTKTFTSLPPVIAQVPRAYNEISRRMLREDVRTAGLAEQAEALEAAAEELRAVDVVEKLSAQSRDVLARGIASCIAHPRRFRVLAAFVDSACSGWSLTYEEVRFIEWLGKSRMSLGDWKEDRADVLGGVVTSADAHPPIWGLARATWASFVFEMPEDELRASGLER